MHTMAEPSVVGAASMLVAAVDERLRILLPNLSRICGEVLQAMPQRRRELRERLGRRLLAQDRDQEALELLDVLISADDFPSMLRGVPGSSSAKRPHLQVLIFLVSAHQSVACFVCACLSGNSWRCPALGKVLLLHRPEPRKGDVSRCASCGPGDAACGRSQEGIAAVRASSAT